MLHRKLVAAKLARKRAEEDLKLLCNRIGLLKQEEGKVCIFLCIGFRLLEKLMRQGRGQLILYCNVGAILRTNKWKRKDWLKNARSKPWKLRCTLTCSKKSTKKFKLTNNTLTIELRLRQWRRSKKKHWPSSKWSITDRLRNNELSK